MCAICLCVCVHVSKAYVSSVASKQSSVWHWWGGLGSTARLVYWCFATARAKLKVVSQWTVLSVFFRIVSTFNIMKILTLLVHAGLFWCFYNSLNFHIHGLESTR